MAGMSEAAVRALVENMFERYDARIGEIMQRSDLQFEEVRAAAVAINNNLVDLSEQTRGMGERVSGHEAQLLAAAQNFDEMEARLATATANIELQVKELENTKEKASLAITELHRQQLAGAEVFKQEAANAKGELAAVVSEAADRFKELEEET